MEILIIAILIVISVMYSILILCYSVFFKRSVIIKTEDKIAAFVKVSIIIPARNEAQRIGYLLNSILDQSYPADYIEVIVIDDASTDKTYQIAKTFADDNPSLHFKVLKIEENKQRTTYKKYAISKAIAVADGDLIVTTDADCMVGVDWIKGVVNAYKHTKAKMLVGLVAYHNDNVAFEKMQHLEFLSLIASGAAAVESGYPIMCNGANLIYEKKAFNEVNGFKTNDDFASGDDVFLLLKMKKHFGKKSISVLTDKDTLVYTQATKTLKDFTNQRLRWASKTRGYKDFNILLVAGIVFAFNLAIIACSFYGICDISFLFYGLLMLILKIFIDFPIILAITKFVNRKDLLIFYLPMQIFYLPYIVIIGVIGNFVSYKWKGRTITN